FLQNRSMAYGLDLRKCWPVDCIGYEKSIAHVACSKPATLGRRARTSALPPMAVGCDSSCERSLAGPAPPARDGLGERAHPGRPRPLLGGGQADESARDCLAEPFTRSGGGKIAVPNFSMKNRGVRRPTSMPLCRR